MQRQVGRDGKIACKACNVPHHYPREQLRLPIIFTALAMCNWHGNFKTNGTYEGNKVHVDVIAIPGATINELIEAYRVELANYKRPIDVFLVAGLNDVSRGLSARRIIERILTFRQTVLNRHDTSTFAAATLYFPPALCRLSGELPGVLKEGNKKDIIVEINAAIIETNRTKPQYLDVWRAPHFQDWGHAQQTPTKQRGPAP